MLRYFTRSFVGVLFELLTFQFRKGVVITPLANLYESSMTIEPGGGC